MPRFFSDHPPIDGELRITGDDAWHIARSLRLRLNDRLTVCCNRVDYSCTILSISDSEIRLRAESSSMSKEPFLRLTLYAALPKKDKLELVIMKATELGAERIVPVLTEFCALRLTGEQFAKKKQRLERIAYEAAKQSGRGIIPQISDIISLDEAVSEMRSMDLGIMLYEKGGVSLGSLGLAPGEEKSVGLLVGPEGGFSEREARLCQENGIKTVWLGPRILRCETAPIAAISILLFLNNDM